MLSPRLEALASQVPVGAKLADIGTDHGLIPVYLAKNQMVTKAIATDISEGSLQKAQVLVREESLEDMIETRLGPGLKVIKSGEVDTIIIAGMGGILIREILDEGESMLRSPLRLILQPMNAQEQVRRWLVEQGYAMDHELLVRDGKYIYEVIVATQGFQEVIDEIQYEIGFKLIENKDPLFKEFIDMKISKTEAIIRELKKQNMENTKGIMGKFTDKLKKYKEACRWFAQ